MFWSILARQWRASRALRDEWFGGSLTLGGLAVSVGLLVHGLTEWTFGDQEVVTLFWVALGLSLAVAGADRRKRTAEG